MKNCQKCNSENIKKYPIAARRKSEGGKFEILSDSNMMVSYHCLDCNNDWQVKFNEDDSLEAQK